MNGRWCLRCLLAAMCMAVRVSAQPAADTELSPPDGERYVVEATALAWMPGADIQFASDGPGAPGSTIDGRHDAGMADARFGEVSLVARLGRRHKVRFQYIPIAYAGSATPPHDLIFNGRPYPAGVKVTATLDWTAYRIGYEYDALSRPRWFVGIVGEVKQTDIRVRLVSATANESRRTRVPVPALGGILRVHATRRLSISGELTGMAVPDSADRRYGGHYIDADVYGTFSVARHLAAQAGFRSLDLRHLGESDSAKLRLRGPYVGAVVRLGGS